MYFICDCIHTKKSPRHEIFKLFHAYPVDYPTDHTFTPVLVRLPIPQYKRSMSNKGMAAICIAQINVYLKRERHTHRVRFLFHPHNFHIRITLDDKFHPQLNEVNSIASVGHEKNATLYTAICSLAMRVNSLVQICPPARIKCR